MQTFAATNVPLTVSHSQFGLGLVMILLLQLVFITIEYSLFVSLIFLLVLCIKMESKKINKTKNAPFYRGWTK